MKKSTNCTNYLVALLFLSLTINAQIYSNGPISTGLTSLSGVTAPSGYTWSEMQNTTGITTQANATSGLPAYFNAAGTISYRLADDFTVPAGQQWNITSIDFFGYQSVYEGATPPIDQLRVQIYNTNPSLPGATPIVGNMTTNVYDAANSGNEFVYRIFNSLYPSPGQIANSSRRIYRLRGTILAILLPGTYWVEYQVHPTDDGNVFFPPVTIVGSRGAVGANAKIHVVASTYPSDVIGWSTNILDSGIPTSAPDVAQDLPFKINGGATLQVDNFNQNSFQVSPNPVVDYLNIKSNESIKSISIYTLLGQLINEKDYNDVAIQMDLSFLNSGNYFVKITSENNQKTLKIIKS
jgi:Secretion system C-terminal sorting domain